MKRRAKAIAASKRKEPAVRMGKPKATAVVRVGIPPALPGGRLANVLDSLSGRTDFDAASNERLLWMRGPTAGATPSENELETLRNRIRHQIRNNPLALAGAETRAINVVTHKLKPQSQIKADDPATASPRHRGYLITEQMAERFRSQIEMAWPIFAEMADPTGELAFEDLTYIVGRKTYSEDGEILMHKVGMPTGGDRQFHTAFEPIEVDRLRTPPDKIMDGAVQAGVRVDENGAPVAFYVLKKHPADGWGFMPSDYHEIPATNARHIFRHKRPGQRRGMPDVASTLGPLRDHKDLQDSTILKSQHSATVTAVMTTESPEEVETAFKHDTDEKKEDKTWTTVTMPSGQIMLVPPTDNITEFKSDHPSQTYESFIKGVKGDAAIGQLMSYLSLTRDGTGVNYSSMRGLYLQDRMVFLFDRALLKRRWLQWAWQCFCDEAVLAGWVDAPFYMVRRHAYTRVAWQFAPWGWVDPVKEVTAKILARKENILSLPEICGSEGGDYEETIRANVRAEKFLAEERKRQGVTAPVEKKPKPFGGKAEDDDEEEDSDARGMRLIVQALEEMDKKSPEFNGKSRFS